MTTQLVTLFLGVFLLTAGVVSGIDVRRFLAAAIALPFITVAAAVVTVALWVFVL